MYKTPINNYSIMAKKILYYIIRSHLNVILEHYDM